MKIVFITQIKNDYLSNALSKIGEVDVVNSPEMFDIHMFEHDAVIISADFGKKAINLLIQAYRKSDSLFVTPIFAERNSRLFLDEKEVLVDNLKEQIENIKALYLEIKPHNYSQWENRVLSYFYTRPDFSIMPKIEEKNPMFYYYPLVEQFFDGQEDYFYWLEEMVRQNILSRVKVVDRLFCCPFCFSALMKFSDHCPACGSINIRNEKFIHCFTCGHVAPESKFVKDGRLICPSCRTKLKLIGEDYDRPLENGVCMDCGNYHIDSKLVVHCLTCKKEFSTEELNKKVIYEYKLTEMGRNQIRFGTVNMVYMIVNELNYMALSHFNVMLDWFINMQKRYTEECFGMMAIKILLNEATSSYDLILDFSKFLRASFRNTDLCSKIDNNTFVFAFPKTDAHGLSLIKERMESFLKTMELRKGRFDVVSVYYSSAEKDLAAENAQKILMELAAAL